MDNPYHKYWIFPLSPWFFSRSNVACRTDHSYLHSGFLVFWSTFWNLSCPYLFHLLGFNRTILYVCLLPRGRTSHLNLECNRFRARFICLSSIIRGRFCHRPICKCRSHVSYHLYIHPYNVYHLTKYTDQFHPYYYLAILPNTFYRPTSYKFQILWSYFHTSRHHTWSHHSIHIFHVHVSCLTDIHLDKLIHQSKFLIHVHVEDHLSRILRNGLRLRGGRFLGRLLYRCSIAHHKHPHQYE